jgi:hypothetical protein
MLRCTAAAHLRCKLICQAGATLVAPILMQPLLLLLLLLSFVQ